MSHDNFIMLRQPEPESDEYNGDHGLDAIVCRIYIQLDAMLRFEAQARASWLVDQVTEYFRPPSAECSDVPSTDVSWLPWEEINAGRINIDKYGGLTHGSFTAV